MMSDNERHLILEMIDSGKITAEEGLRLLRTLSDAGDEETEPVDQFPSLEADSTASPAFTEGNASHSVQGISAQEVLHGEPLSEDGEPAPASPFMPEDVEKWRRWWMLPIWVGAALIILAGALMFWAQQTYGLGFWFYCAWLPFLLGLGLMVIAWGSRTARWLHVRVQQGHGEWPRNIAISFPLPIRMTAWFFRLFGGRIPGLRGTSIDELILALDQTTTSDNPLYVKVDEGENGERVEVFIG